MVVLKASSLKIYLITLISLVAVLLLPGLGPATEEYAQKTGQI
ncbi:MAG: hypothetical protein PHD01_08985 [Geobacteraceae bacterium]|nr:hypothetical protein [Geobacteraceae bacterium]